MLAAVCQSEIPVRKEFIRTGKKSIISMPIHSIFGKWDAEGLT
jgi:hypothetical protein